MPRPITLFLTIALLLGAVPAAHAQTAAGSTAIRSTALDHIAVDAARAIGSLVKGYYCLHD